MYGSRAQPCDGLFPRAAIRKAVPDEERLRAIEQVVRDEPEDPLGHYLLGIEYRMLGRLDDAANALRRAIERDPDYTAAYRELGKALRDAGKREEAIDAFERGLAVAERTRDLQTGKEMAVLLKRLRA